MKLEGADSLIKALQSSSRETKKAIPEKAFRKHAKKMLNYAKRNAPLDSGSLRSSLRITKVSQSIRGRFASMKVKISSPYAFVYEFGTRPGTKAYKILGARKGYHYMFGYSDEHEEAILTEAHEDIFEELARIYER